MRLKIVNTGEKIPKSPFEKLLEVLKDGKSIRVECNSAHCSYLVESVPNHRIKSGFGF